MNRSELETQIKGLQKRRTERKRFLSVVTDELENAKKRGLKTRADQLEEMSETETANLSILDTKIKANNARLKKFN